MQKNRFLLLFVALFLLLIVLPVVRSLGIGAHPQIASAIVAAAFAIMLLASIYAVSDRRSTFIIAVLLAGATVILSGIYIVSGREDVLLANHICSILFLLFAAALILKHLFSVDRVTHDTILASLCLFLLLGLLSALAYSMIEILSPGSFILPTAAKDTAAAMRFGGEQSIYPIYFSFVTLTTLGYGDIIPISTPARMTAIAEAVTGQLYLVVLVARLVGLHIAHSSGGKDSK